MHNTPYSFQRLLVVSSPCHMALYAQVDTPEWLSLLVLAVRAMRSAHCAGEFQRGLKNNQKKDGYLLL